MLYLAKDVSHSLIDYTYSLTAIDGSDSFGVSCDDYNDLVETLKNDGITEVSYMCFSK